MDLADRYMHLRYEVRNREIDLATLRKHDVPTDADLYLNIEARLNEARRQLQALEREIEANV